jgi:hypothetical protein
MSVDPGDQEITHAAGVLEESIADPSFVGSARSEEAYQYANGWLNQHAPSSRDQLYVRVGQLVVEYVQLKNKNS